jgi:hypothetical protein
VCEEELVVPQTITLSVGFFVFAASSCASLPFTSGVQDVGTGTSLAAEAQKAAKAAARI